MQAVSVNKRTTPPTEKVGYSSLFSLDTVPFGSSFRDVPSRRIVSTPPANHPPDELIQDHLERQRKFVKLVMVGQYAAALSESMAPQDSSALTSIILSEEELTLSSTAQYVLHRQLWGLQQSNQCAQREIGMETYDHPIPTRAITRMDGDTKQ
jgi:hypothetical protein